MQTKEKGGLVLTRRRGQSIEVDGPARIVVDRLGNGEVRLRIFAERWVTVDRSEVAERKART